MLLLITHPNFDFDSKIDLINYAIDEGNYSLFKVLLQEIPWNQLPAQMIKKIDKISQDAKKWGMTEQEYIEQSYATSSAVNQQRWAKLFNKEQLVELAPLIASSISPYGFNIKLYDRSAFS